MLPFPIKIHPIKIFTRATPGISLVFLYKLVFSFAGYLPVSEGGPVVTTYGGGHVSSLNAAVDTVAVAAAAAAVSTQDAAPHHHHHQHPPAHHLIGTTVAGPFDQECPVSSYAPVTVTSGGGVVLTSSPSVTVAPLQAAAAVAAVQQQADMNALLTAQVLSSGSFFLTPLGRSREGQSSETLSFFLEF